ncbi:MAG: dTDP-4-dehydrorhamnose 3,5-epimerase family protein [Chitinophagaceae bacterium]|nr:dTDP-4-dehydrorhamnose 3,5-epimerase family protein [Chitinophagaceae bacterium]
MQFIQQAVKDVWHITFNVFSDSRGAFSRLFCNDEFYEHLGYRLTLNQINLSEATQKGTFKGIHFQKAPFAEYKMVICLKGVIHDYAVDLREGSSSFLQHVRVELDANRREALLLPPYVGHAFQTLTKDVQLLYLHSSFYNKEFEDGCRYDDPLIKLPLELPISEISERDLGFTILNQNFTGYFVT